MGILEKLSDREIEVVKELALGFTEKEAACRLFVAPVTVHNHTYNMRKKTNSRSNLELVVKFILSLDNPKQYFAALMLLFVQFFAMAIMETQPVRRIPKLSSTARYSCISRRNIESV